MPKRVSEDERVVSYFQQLDLARAEWLLSVLKAIVKGRTVPVVAKVAAKGPAKKKAVAKKVTPVTQTITNSEEMKNAN